MVIRKGSVYWVDFSPGKGSELLGMRPGLVIQSDVLNDSKISTVIMVAITSTLKFGELPGNVVLNKGEDNFRLQVRRQRYSNKVGRQTQHQRKSRDTRQEAVARDREWPSARYEPGINILKIIYDH